MHITVQVRNVYGVEAIYPADAKAEIFALIAGTKTLTRAVIGDIKMLGYEVRVKQPEVVTL